MGQYFFYWIPDGLNLRLCSYDENVKQYRDQDEGSPLPFFYFSGLRKGHHSHGAWIQVLSKSSNCSPFPAASRPSKIMATRRPVIWTSRCNFTNGNVSLKQSQPFLQHVFLCLRSRTRDSCFSTWSLCATGWSRSRGLNLKREPRGSNIPRGHPPRIRCPSPSRFRHPRSKRYALSE